MIVCSRCSKENQDHYKFCLGCGAELPRQSAKPQSVSSGGGTQKEGRTTNAPPPRAAASGALASAPKLEIEPEPEAPSRPEPVAVADRLPPELAPLNDETAPCPHCGAQVPDNFRFCHVCGHDLHAASAGSADAGATPEERTSAPAVAEAPARSAPRARLILIQPDGS